jgi:hypothetical protein
MIASINSNSKLKLFSEVKNAVIRSGYSGRNNRVAIKKLNNYGFIIVKRNRLQLNRHD